jgi:hypothetical protein
VDERGGDLDPLAHALGVGLDAAVLGLFHLHRGQGLAGGSGRVGQAVELGRGQDELPAGQEAVHALPFRD